MKVTGAHIQPEEEYEPHQRGNSREAVLSLCYKHKQAIARRWEARDTGSRSGSEVQDGRKPAVQGKDCGCHLQEGRDFVPFVPLDDPAPGRSSTSTE